MGEGDFVYLTVEESFFDMCFDTAYGRCVGESGQTWIDVLLFK